MCCGWLSLCKLLLLPATCILVERWQAVLASLHNVLFLGFHTCDVCSYYWPRFYSLNQEQCREPLCIWLNSYIEEHLLTSGWAPTWPKAIIFKTEVTCKKTKNCRKTSAIILKSIIPWFMAVCWARNIGDCFLEKKKNEKLLLSIPICVCGVSSTDKLSGDSCNLPDGRPLDDKTW